MHRSGVILRKHNCACDYLPVRVFCRQICRCHTLYLQGIWDLKHVLSNTVNRLMGRVMKVGLNHTDFRLKLNLVDFMHAWNYLESRHELKLQDVLLHALNL